MADYHVLAQDKQGKSVDVVFHISVPNDVPNRADLAWKAAIVLKAGGADQITSCLSNISEAEETQLKAGEILEKRDTVRFSQISLSDAEKLSEIEAEFNRLMTDLITEIKLTHNWVGYEDNVT